jgi:hypothetical protein
VPEREGELFAESLPLTPNFSPCLICLLLLPTFVKIIKKERKENYGIVKSRSSGI